MSNALREHGVLKPHGTLITTPWDGPEVHQDTIQCVHCYRHWVYKPGSGKTRGFCTRCNGFVCGPKCAECVPKEAKLENIEAGRDVMFRPVTISVPCDISKF